MNTDTPAAQDVKNASWRGWCEMCKRLKRGVRAYDLDVSLLQQCSTRSLSDRVQVCVRCAGVLRKMTLVK